MANFYGQYPPTSGSGGGGSGTGFTQSDSVALIGGTITVANGSVAADSIFFTSCNAVSGIQGLLSIANVVPGVSFDIVSTSDSDNSTIAWGFI